MAATDTLPAKRKRLQKYRREWEETNTWLDSVSITNTKPTAKYVGVSFLWLMTAWQTLDRTPQESSIPVL